MIKVPIATPSRRRAVVGPLAIVTCVVSAAWLGVAVGWGISGVWPIAGWLAGAAGLIGVGLAVMGVRMIVVTSAEGVRVIGQPRLSWSEIEQISVRRLAGWLPLHVPVLSASRGRSLIGLELDGLSSLGHPAGALRFAQEIADRGGLGEVEVIGATTSVRARRLDV
ncbi:MAG: hypothetical protein WAS07_10130 [Micropruina sp.]